MAPVLAVEEPFISQEGHQMRKDPCYLSYAEALQCLDKNDYQQPLCAREFLAFKACRRQQSAAADDSRMKFHESDPILGWAFKLYNNWTADHQTQKQQTNSNSSSQPVYRRWQPPPDDKLREEVRPVSSPVYSSGNNSTSSSDSSSSSSIASPPKDLTVTSSSDGSSDSSGTTLEASQGSSLWGWAFRWYNGRKAAEDTVASSGRVSSPDASSLSPQQQQQQQQQQLQ